MRRALVLPFFLFVGVAAACGGRPFADAHSAHTPAPVTPTVTAVAVSGTRQPSA